MLLQAADSLTERSATGLCKVLQLPLLPRQAAAHQDRHARFVCGALELSNNLQKQSHAIEWECPMASEIATLAQCTTASVADPQTAGAIGPVIVETSADLCNL